MPRSHLHVPFRKTNVKRYWQNGVGRDYLVGSYGVYVKLILHSKNTRATVTRKRVQWGQTLFRENDDPEISQLDAEYDPELGQSDP